MNFKIWRTINIGIYKNVESLEEALINNGFQIGGWADDILNSKNFSLSQKEVQTSLVKITAKDLGFDSGASRKDIYKEAIRLGLKLCPLEVGPYLRLQYKNQPKIESLQIGMKSQTASDGHIGQFRIAHSPDDILWLVGDHKHPTDFWGKDEAFIFVLL